MIKKFIGASLKTIDQDAGTFEVIASTGKMDRMGDTISPEGWYLTNYKKNPVVLWSHSTGGLGGPAIPPVAKATKVWIEGNELKIKGEWATTPFANELRTLVEGGFLNAVSVGFMPLVEAKKGMGYEIEGKFYRRATDDEIQKGIYDSPYGEKFNKQELLEVSWVGVPALPQALVTARKMNLSLVTKALEEKIEDSSKAPEEDTEKEEDEESKIVYDTESDLEKRMKEVENTLTKLEEAISLSKGENPERETASIRNPKGRKSFVKQKSKKSDMERLLIMFDKMTETLLRKLRQSKNE